MNKESLLVDNVRRVLLLSLAIFTSSCSSILAGTSQTLTINSVPPGARCELDREGRVIGVVEKTPGAVTVSKTKHDIGVKCSLPGYHQAPSALESGTEGATFGNIAAGGFIGWGIDSATGADNKYPEITTVTLVPDSNRESQPTPSSSVLAALPESSQKTETLKSRLKTLEQLKKDGLISNKDFEEKKRQILSEL